MFPTMKTTLLKNELYYILWTRYLTEHIAHMSPKACSSHIFWMIRQKGWMMKKNESGFRSCQDIKNVNRTRYMSLIYTLGSDNVDTRPLRHSHGIGRFRRCHGWYYRISGRSGNVFTSLLKSSQKPPWTRIIPRILRVRDRQSFSETNVRRQIIQGIFWS